MPTRRIPDREIHKGIAEAIRTKNEEFVKAWNRRKRGRRVKMPKFRLSARHWQTSTQPVTADGKSLNNLYQLAFIRRVGGKPFFGHGSWDEYLEKQHGVVPMHQEHWSDERVHVSIARQLEKQANASARHWQTSTQPVTADGRSLQSLYALAKVRRVGGKPFFGHGSWDEYLEKQHGAVPIHQKEWSDERIHTTIARQLGKQANASAGRWQTSTQPVTADGKSLNNLYQLARLRRVSDKPFFGHGSWDEYVAYVRESYAKRR